MSVLGADALGHWALGHPPGVSATGGITQAAGTGVAGAITANPAALIIGATGTGVAGTVQGQSPGEIAGASGLGVARALTSSVQAGGITQASGAGVASIIPGPSGNFSGAFAAGLAGTITVSISGGGGGKKKTTGLEPVKKRKPPEAPALAPLPIPPTRPLKLRVAEQAPVEIVSPKLIPTDILDLQDQVLSAQDIADVQAFLHELELEDQDAQDIADVLALLD